MTKASINFSFGSEHTKQLGREGMNKLTKKALRKATTVVRSIVGCTPSLFSLLVLVFAITFCGASAALAQNAGANAAKQAQPTKMDSNDQSFKNIIDQYDKRFPFQKAQRQADTHTRKVPGTNLDESDPGSTRTTPVYMPVYNSQGYMQPLLNAVNTTPQSRDNEIYSNTLTTFGMPLTDTQFQMINRENNQRKVEQLWDPEKAQWMTKATAQLAGASAANSMAGTAEQSFATALDRIVNADGGNCLINVANEASGAAFPGMVMYKTIPEAVGMVQAMYKRVFIPMAILFLLPGAVASQVKGQIGRGFNLGYAEGANPFEGILRSIVAVFLVPATQVIVSWSIDTGNSMAMSVRDWVDTGMIQDWANQLSYNTSPQKDENLLRSTIPGAGGAGAAGGGGAGGAGGGGGGSGGGLGGIISGIGASIGGVIGSWLSSLGSFITSVGGGGTGLGAQVPEAAAIYEQQGALSQIMQLNLNMMMNTASIFLVILGAYQVVMICYLFLLGPLAAAFYAWPQVTGSRKLFRNVFGSWVEGVIQVSLWRFYWMVVLAVITQRLIYTNGGTNNLQWEVCMFTCFLGILLWAPSSPFNFSPNGGLGQAEKLAADNKKQGGGGGGKGGGGGEKGEPGSPGGSDNKTTPGEHTSTERGSEAQPTVAPENNNGNSNGNTRVAANDANQGDNSVGAAPPQHGGSGGENNQPAPAAIAAAPPLTGGKEGGGSGPNEGSNAKPQGEVQMAMSVGGGDAKVAGGMGPNLTPGQAGTKPNPSLGGGKEGSDSDKGDSSGAGKGAGGTTVVAAAGGAAVGNIAASAAGGATQNLSQAQNSHSGSIDLPPKEKKDDIQQA